MMLADTRNGRRVRVSVGAESSSVPFSKQVHEHRSSRRSRIAPHRTGASRCNLARLCVECERND